MTSAVFPMDGAVLEMGDRRSGWVAHDTIRCPQSLAVRKPPPRVCRFMLAWRVHGPDKWARARHRHGHQYVCPEAGANIHLNLLISPSLVPLRLRRRSSHERSYAPSNSAGRDNHILAVPSVPFEPL